MIIERKSQITASQFFYCRIAPKKGSYIKEQFCKKKKHHCIGTREYSPSLLSHSFTLSDEEREVAFTYDSEIVWSHPTCIIKSALDLVIWCNNLYFDNNFGYLQISTSISLGCWVTVGFIHVYPTCPFNHIKDLYFLKKTLYKWDIIHFFGFQHCIFTMIFLSSYNIKTTDWYDGI